MSDSFFSSADRDDETPPLLTWKCNCCGDEGDGHSACRHCGARSWFGVHASSGTRVEIILGAK